MNNEAIASARPIMAQTIPMMGMHAASTKSPTPAAIVATPKVMPWKIKERMLI